MRGLQRSILLPTLLLAIFITYKAGITLFIHTHVLMNGAVVAHSHPYDNEEHSHSDAQIIAFHVASVTQCLEPAIYNYAETEWYVTDEYIDCQNIAIDILSYISCYTTRAPTIYC